MSAFAEWRAPHCVLGLAPRQYPPGYSAWRNQRAHNPDSALPGGESLPTLAERALEATTTAHDLATQHGPVLIVSHRLLIGAVAALHHGDRHPADIFGYASDFPPCPAHLWAPPREIL
ncbi:MAG: histidine phosphatase family protein [Pseudonocardiaceae bacterium]